MVLGTAKSGFSTFKLNSKLIARVCGILKGAEI
jgi:hypothetical protein